ncbi:MAG: hypothetical protein ACOCTQ_00555 [Planctomycetota bacterium]
MSKKACHSVEVVLRGMPVVHWTQWPETRERWVEERMPEDANVRELRF